MKINQAFTILQRAGGVRAARIITENNGKLSWYQVRFAAWQLRRGVPVAKIIHKKWFYGLAFYTNRHTLDPRPDTETLVAAVIADNPKSPRIMDMGTGTGCIICALCANIDGASGVATDISRGAIAVARKNVKNLGLGDKISVVRRAFADMRGAACEFDVIVSNPPYIAHGDKRVDGGAAHDPARALYAKNNGLAAYQQIAHSARAFIRVGGRIYLEIGAGQEKDVQQIFKNAGWRFVRTESDLGGIIRVLVFEYVI